MLLAEQEENFSYLAHFAHPKLCNVLQDTLLEQQQYLTRHSHAQRSMVLTAKGIALAERWQLLVPVAEEDVETMQEPRTPVKSSRRGKQALDTPSR